tara:strand:- start:290 stop:490 length:201 start_codon:yes stop_codon:yes gene_type:complete
MCKEQKKVQTKKYYRANELKELLAIGLSTVWLYAQQKRITPIKLSPRVTVFSIDEINKVFNLNSEV